MDYSIEARRIDETGSLAQAHGAEVRLATDMAGRRDAFNPVELLLSALAACMIKGIERVTPRLEFRFDTVRVELRAHRQDDPPLLTRIDYEIIVTSDESDQRLALLHRNVLKYGTISNTLSASVPLSGTLRRA